MKVEGVYVPIVTAFDANDDVDYDACARVIEHCLLGGAHGLVPCGTTGEYYALTHDERVALLRHTVDVTAGRAQLIAGCNAGSTRQAIALASTARDYGYDAIMLAAPPTSLPTQRELAAHFIAVNERSAMPVILYNFPARAGVEIGIECLDAIADHPGIIAIKESSGDFSRFLHLRRRYADRLTIICGSDDQAVDYFAWGVRAWLAGTANVLPRHHAEIVAAANRGDIDNARRGFDAILPWVQDCESGAYNQKMKLGLRAQGIECGDVRPPLRPLDDDAAVRYLNVLAVAIAAPMSASASAAASPAGR